MILVDTSIWIDQLHAPEPRLAALLNADQVGCTTISSKSWRSVSLGRRDQESQDFKAAIDEPADA